MRGKLALMVAGLCLVLQACTNIGPGTVKRDRFDYNTAISDSWKQQTLLNVVKLRYADMPVFVEVASVVSGYQLEGSVNLAASASESGSVQGDLLSFGTTGRYIDRPTVTYQPITGAKFNRSFMTPLPPRAILFLLQSGWSAELVLPLTVDSINGLRARMAAGVGRRQGDEGYYRVVRLMDSLRRSNAVGMQIRKKGEDDTTVLFFYKQGLTQEVREQVQELFQLLDLDAQADELNVNYGHVPRTRREIAMSTLSMLQILVKLATLVDVPEEDVTSGATVPSLNSPPGFDPIIRVHHGAGRPERPFVSARYRDRWFWIEDGDFRSKRTFTFLMVLFSLTETGGREGLPLVTIPAS